MDNNTPSTTSVVPDTFPHHATGVSGIEHISVDWPKSRVPDVVGNLLGLYAIHDVLGTAEVAELLECPKQQIYALRKRVDFPKPIGAIKATPLWNRQDILVFKKSWIRRKKVL